MSRTTGKAAISAANQAGVGVTDTGQVMVTLTAQGGTGDAIAAVHRLGGLVVATIGTTVSASVAPSALTALAQSAGVGEVVPSVQGMAADGFMAAGGSAPASNAALAASDADQWQDSGITGTGVKVGVIDVGFAGLQTAETNGDIPAANIVYDANPDAGADPNTANHCGNASTSTDHGTQVVNVLHTMAPGATLYLYCANESVGFASAASQARTAGVRIISSSMTFADDPYLTNPDPSQLTTTTPANTVKTARKAGILWFQAAGNTGVSHLSGTAVDADGDGRLDLTGTGRSHEIDKFFADGHSEQVSFQWAAEDASKPTVSSLGFSITYWEIDSSGALIDSTMGPPSSNPPQHTPGTLPGIVLTLPAPTNGAAGWAIQVNMPAGTKAVRWDLSYTGDPIETTTLADPTSNPTSANGSIAEPAASPYAIAVGAVDVAGTSGVTGGGTCGGIDGDGPDDIGGFPLEDYSSRGPTVDGRVKPDLLGFDGMGALNDSVTTGGSFCGTSAATPTVAGAAALVMANAPSWSADAVQARLEAWAGTAAPTPRTGYGVLFLGPNSDWTVTLKLTNTPGPGSAPVFAQSYGTPVRASVAVLEPDGSIPEGTVSLFDSAGHVVVDGLPAGPGTHSVTLPSTMSIGATSLVASYRGSDTMARPVSPVLPFTVNQAPATVSSTVAPSTAVTYGANPTIGVTVTASVTPTGPVDVTSSAGTLLGSGALAASTGTTGTAQITLAAPLPVGSPSLTVAYLGSDLVAASQQQISLTVSAAKPIFAITQAPGKVGFGISPHLGVKVTSNTGVIPTGGIKVMSGNTVVGNTTLTANGTATVTLASTLSIAVRQLTVVYGGDGRVTSKSYSSSQTVLNTVRGTPRIVASPVKASYPYGSGPRIIAVVYGPTSAIVPTGTASLLAGAKTIAKGTLANGRVTLVLPANMAIGRHGYTLTYSGSSLLIPVSTTTAMTVIKATPSIGASLAATRFRTANQDTVAISARVAGYVPTGLVQIVTGSRVLGQAQLSKGAARFKLIRLAPGGYALTLKYAGSGVVNARSVFVKNIVVTS